MRFATVLLATLCFASVANAQVFRFEFPEPKVTIKPPTIDDIKREVENAGKEVKEAWDNIRNLDPAGVSEELWGEAGRAAYVAAARIMEKRSPTGEALDKAMKHHLRRGYGDLVDKVTIHWGTPTLDEWAASRFKIRLTATDSEAQTYGYDIYTRWQKDEKSRTYLMMLMSHELIHSRQYERYGKSLSNFGYHYFKEYKKANLNYENNKLEREAYEDSPRVAAPSCYLESQRGPEGNEGQRWVFQDAGNGFSLLTNVRLSREIGTYMVLDYRDGNFAYLEERRGKNGNEAQRWKITDTGGGLCLIENARLSREKRTSTVLDYGGREVAYLESQRGGKGNEAQRWRLKDIGDGQYVIENPRRTRELGRAMVLDYRD